MQNPPFIKDQIYHVYNRGVDKRNIFMDKHDYFRFIHDLYEFNDEKPADNLNYKRRAYQTHEVSLREDRRPLVDILAYALMPNHIHLMLRPRSDEAVTLFMRKLGTGYTNYFNALHERSGSLFQGKFKAKLLEVDAHFTYLPYYIHLNPLDLIAPEWRAGAINDMPRTLAFLERYRWSSHLDYAGVKNFRSLLEMAPLLESFGGHEHYLKDIQRYLSLMQSDSHYHRVHFDED